MNFKVIGVTGASGAGKSTVCEILRGLGAYIIDADKIAHAIIKKDQPAYNEILECFYDKKHLFLDDNGEIVRKCLGDLVFYDEKLLSMLTKITHKYIFTEIEKEVARAAKNGGFAVIDAPLLFEAKLDALCDGVIGVVADERIRVSRIMVRDGLTEPQARARVNKQIKEEELLKKSDLVIENNGKQEELLKYVETQICKFLGDL